jgi:molecular chaperone DnaK
MTAIGIDYGTKYSAVSYLDSEGLPVLITDVSDLNQKLTQSVVTLDAEYPLVGKEAKEFVDKNPNARLIKWAKLDLGTYEDYFIDKQGRKWRIEAIAALVLAKLRRDAKRALNSEVSKLTLTVPVHYPAERRYAIMQAALLAGLPKPQLLEEPIAAALYYERNLSKQDNTILVYDFGAGTFDVSIIRRKGKEISVLGKGGNRLVGGKFIDQQFAEYLLKRLRVVANSTVNSDFEIPTDFENELNSLKLLDLAESWKEELSYQHLIERDVEYQGDSYPLRVNRSQFDKVTSSLIDQTIGLTIRCLEDCELTWQAIDNIYLVGGSSNIPKVEEKIRVKSGLPPGKIILNNPFEAVTLGAAMASSSNDTVIDRLPVGDLGITIWDNAKNCQVFKSCIRRSQMLPVTYSENFYTNRPDQHVVDLEISIRSMGGGLRTIGFCSFSLPKLCPANTSFKLTLKYTEFRRIDVEFEVDKHEQTSYQTAVFNLELEHEKPEWFEKQKRLVQEYFEM